MLQGPKIVSVTLQLPEWCIRAIYGYKLAREANLPSGEEIAREIEEYLEKRTGE